MVAATHVSDKDRTRWFYFGMALACAGVCLVGFAPTTFIPMTLGTYSQPLLVHLHGMSMSAWMILFCVQTWLAATGRIQAHRSLGLAGIAVATSIVILMLTAVAVDLGHAKATLGEIPGPLRFLRASAIVQVSLFVVWFVLALVNLKRPDWHKRLMVVATIGLLPAAFGRMVRIWFYGGVMQPMPMAVLGTLAMCTMIAIPLIHDWRTRGRPHPVYIAGFAVYLTNQLVISAFSASAAWTWLMDVMMGAGG